MRECAVCGDPCGLAICQWCDDQIDMRDDCFDLVECQVGRTSQVSALISRRLAPCPQPDTVIIA